MICYKYVAMPLVRRSSSITLRRACKKLQSILFYPIYFSEKTRNTKECIFISGNERKLKKKKASLNTFVKCCAREGESSKKKKIQSLNISDHVEFRLPGKGWCSESDHQPPLTFALHRLLVFPILWGVWSTQQRDRPGNAFFRGVKCENKAE